MNSYQGIRVAKHPKRELTVVEVKYSADPEKNAAWVAATEPTYGNKQLWDQEQEVKFDAYEGSRLFPEFKRELTVIDPVPIPLDATFYMAIDPHPRRPHAFLWVYVDRSEDIYVCREFWPSKIYGLRGKTPEDDVIYSLSEYAATVKWMEGPEPNLFGPNGYTDNQGREQPQYRRVMDTAGKGWASERKDGQDQKESFWDKYADLDIICENAKKDNWQATRDNVGQLLLPRQYNWGDHMEVHSRLRIFSTCPELILELETCRYPTLTPSQASRQDPSAKPIPMRLHELDCLRYVCAEDLTWVNPEHQIRVRRPPVYPDIPGFVR